MVMQYSDLKPKKPEHIALSFSGGGFLAASYSLGCLSYMESVYAGGKKLTALVRFISSASGGSIINLAYTTSQRKGQPFKEFYNHMNQHVLKGTLLLDHVFKILKSDAYWEERPDKSRNLDNAFSIAYDEMIFSKETFGIYFKPIENTIEEVCINTTEFSNCITFRFQNTGLTGNRFLYFKKEPAAFEALKCIKLGDILACSLCFPGGLEPFMFPNDFTYPGLAKNAIQSSIKEDIRYSPVKDDNEDGNELPVFGIMDGGIDDNQGIDSFILAEERLEHKNKFGYDLYMVCDVTSNYTDGYSLPQENKNSLLEKPSFIQYLLLILLSAMVSIAGITTKTYTELCFSILGISAALLLVVFYISTIGFLLYRKSIKTKNTFGIIGIKHIFTFLHLPLSSFIQTVNSRLTSTVYLASFVFMNKIRRISYDRLFEKITERKIKADGTQWSHDEDESLISAIQLKHWRQFSLQNSIHLLSFKNDYQRIADLKAEPWYKKNPIVKVNGETINLIDFMMPSVALQEVAWLATEMKITLWYDQFKQEDKSAPAIVATGQFTSCYNLLRYAFRFNSSDPYWLDLQQQLMNDWFKFNQSPLWLYDQLASS